MLTTTGGRDARAYYALLLRSTVKERSIFVLFGCHVSTRRRRLPLPTCCAARQNLCSAAWRFAL